MKIAMMTSALCMALAGTAAAETRQIPLSSLAEVRAAGRLDVEIVQGPRPSAVLEGRAEDIARLTVKTDGDVLQVSEKCRVNCGNRDLDVTLRVTAPALRAIRAERGVSVRATGLTAADLELDAAMGAELSAEGRCTKLEAAARMGGVIDADALVCEAAGVRASMGGVASVHAARSVSARASMGGVVDVKGNPAARDTSASMGGVIDLN